MLSLTVYFADFALTVPASLPVLCARLLARFVWLPPHPFCVAACLPACLPAWQVCGGGVLAGGPGAAARPSAPYTPVPHTPGGQQTGPRAVAGAGATAQALGRSNQGGQLSVRGYRTGSRP